MSKVFILPEPHTPADRVRGALDEAAWMMPAKKQFFGKAQNPAPTVSRKMKNAVC